MEDQRTEARTHLIYYLRVFEQNSNALFGHVVDLSPSGMLITSDKPLNSAKTYRLAVEDTTIMEKLGVIDFEAECKWCSEDSENQLWDAGFALIDPSEDFEEMLADFA